MTTAAERWREDLGSWAIPEEILARAPESPWSFPTELFASRADAATLELTASSARALEALPLDGSVLDVGCGAGAASLPLASNASRLVGVDTSPKMLEAFRERAERAGVEALTVLGSWPEVAEETPAADVVVCHHVLYNVPDLPAFATSLTDHARVRVVVELTPEHPTASLNDLWRRFHGINRPTRPTADDSVAVLEEMGLAPRRLDWESRGRGGFADLRDLVAWVRRRLCLPPERDPEIEEALADRVVEQDGRFGFAARRMVVTLWWDGRAPGADAPSRSAPSVSGA